MSEVRRAISAAHAVALRVRLGEAGWPEIEGMARQVRDALQADHPVRVAVEAFVLDWVGGDPTARTAAAGDLGDAVVRSLRPRPAGAGRADIYG